MNKTFQSATFKLTAYYTIIIMVICIIFSTAIYRFASNELQHGLQSQTERIVSQYPGFDFNQALRSSHYYAEGTHRILLNLLYFNFFVLVLSGFAGYGLAKRTLQPIEESHEQQKRFTADVSHELRTPLTALKMSTEVALLDPAATKTELRDVLTSNLEDANKLELLINNLLRLTRLEAAELQHQFTNVDLHQTVGLAVTEADKRIEARKLTIDNQVDKSLEINGDPASLQQLFGILLDNAIKYSPPGETIQISSRSEDEYVMVAITDRGIGIKPDELSHVFERFYRADRARTASGESSGFGLGLSIAKHIADLHKGVIRISSAEGKGTTVEVELPSLQT